MSKVSIVVPIYNPGRKLYKCISSILNQSFKDFELLLINDGSTDQSLSICEQFKKNDSRIMVIEKQNEGTVATRRKGIELAQTNYLMFVDADDWIDEKMVDTLYHEMTENHLDICVSNTILTLGNGMIKRENNSHFFQESKIYEEQDIKKDIITSYFHYGDAYPASLCSKLFKKELLIESGKYLSRIQFFGDDLYYNLEMLLKAKRVKVINTPLYYYRMGGFTNKFMPYFFDDILNGYQIQKEVIQEFYHDDHRDHYKSISTTLLLMFQNGINNLFYSDLSQGEIKGKIKKYTTVESIRESLTRVQISEGLHDDYLSAMKNQDIDYLYTLGEINYKKKKLKRLIKNMITSLTFV